ncbi:carboxynorspermidine decarboxylase [Phocaeicola oris]|uniref:carboxynorspermidine decarboxylase n=1 Tax=Phocaeicola oris TaxID=2896850 RepID=UPI00234EF8D6|nr:carboxynorspermidine decarboxylase [Phocaeicola oris]MCE2617356.1 carboxynorspermidine decarboxylase [Phocaeicola oris]
MLDINKVPSPCYVMEERLLRKNLSLIKHVADTAGVEIILAFKAFAMWKSFSIFREYIHHTTASSRYEARLAFEEFGSKAHTYSPAYTEEDFPEIMRCSGYITFNSFSQFNRFYPMVKASNEKISCGIRVNPEYSEVKVELYNPCAPGSRFGITSDLLPDELPEGIEGFHCHCLCESDAYEFGRTLQHFEDRFGHWMNQLKWVNFGGGHLMTRKGYDVNHLINLLKEFKSRYPNLKVILEPGSAFAWQVGPLVSSVVDIIENHGIRTAILNVSFTCHMPDCLEMPYQPTVRGAETLSFDAVKSAKQEDHIYRLGGNSCLSGDYMGSWKFDHELRIGERIVLEDMIHYTMVKTNMFNGIQHPSIAIWHSDDTLEIYRDFHYEDYKNRMS